MNSCCCCGNVSKSKDATAVGHVFDCQHLLCNQCLANFSKTDLRTVCFTCGSPSPTVDTVKSLSLDAKSMDEGRVNKPSVNSVGGSIIDGNSTKRTVPGELIYDRVHLALTDVSLSRNKSKDKTEAVGQTGRLEEDTTAAAQRPRKTSSGGVTRPLAGLAQKLREKKRELEAAEKSFEEQGTRVRKEIEKHAQMFRALMERDEKRLLQQLDETMNTVLSENSAAISSIWSLIQRLERADELDKEDKHEMEQLLTTRINTTQFKDVKVGVSDFRPPEEKNIVGELKIETIEDHSSFLLSPALVGSISDSRRQTVTGVTSLDREIYVTYDGSSDICVYAVMTGARLRSLSLLRLIEPISVPCPIDLASCRTTRSLYVADGKNNYVFRLRPDGRLINWWAVENLRGLSVTTTGTVLTGSGKAVREYDPSGRLLRTISASPLGSLFRGRERPSMRHPTHFLETDQGRIVVCDFNVDDARSPHVIYDVDRKGSDVACWHGNRADSGDEFLDEPRHLAIDVTGHVIVADRRNDRVKLLDARLKFVRELLGVGQGVKRPQRLHYDPARGLLYVGLIAGDTLVFRVTL